LKKLLSLSNIESSSKVLEVGCGTGNYIVAMEKSVGCSCWGIDPSEKMLSKAKERSGKINFKIGRVEKPGFSDNFFDLVFSVDVIHHIKNRIDYFKEAYHVLKQGGRICTVTDSEWIIRNRKPLSVYFPEAVEPELKRYPPISMLRKIMLEAGFKEISENIVEFHYQLTDIQAYRDKAFSSLYLISEEEFKKGIERMEKDLQRGPIQAVPRYLLLWGSK
jgi:ubiquinone/menaquinone biosynthesis C-methylase UbiE